MALEPGTFGDLDKTWRDLDGNRIRVSHDDIGGVVIRIREDNEWWKYVFLNGQDKAELIQHLMEE